MSNGKGSGPRNCQSQAFRDNYQAINWKAANRKRKQFQSNCRHLWSIPDELGNRECLWCAATAKGVSN